MDWCTGFLIFLDISFDRTCCGRVHATYNQLEVSLVYFPCVPPKGIPVLCRNLLKYHTRYYETLFWTFAILCSFASVWQPLKFPLRKFFPDTTIVFPFQYNFSFPNTTLSVSCYVWGFMEQLPHPTCNLCGSFFLLSVGVFHKTV